MDEPSRPVPVHAVTFAFRGPLFQPADSDQLRALADRRTRLVRDAFPGTSEEAVRKLDATLLTVAGPPEQVQRALERAVAGRGVDAGELSLSVQQIQRLRRGIDDLAREIGWRRVPGAAAVLRHLRQRGYKLGLIANSGWPSGRVVREVLAAEGVLMYFQAFSLADEVGVRKPDPAIFRHALFHLDEESDPAAVVHVGASAETDVAGARAAGLRAILYVPGESRAADAASGYEPLADLRDLPAVIARWAEPHRL